MHDCLINHSEWDARILDNIAAYYVEKDMGAHTLCDSCRVVGYGSCGKCCVNCRTSYQSKSSAWITTERREAIKQAQNFRCVYCQSDLTDTPKDYQTLEHLVSLEEYAHLPAELKIWFGSKHKSGNVVLACRPCNSRRQSVTWCNYASQYSGGVDRVSAVLADRRVLNINAAKKVVGNTRRTYRNAWATRQRLSQGIGTIGA